MSNKITLNIPNEDTYNGYLFVPKEVLQKSYSNSIGKIIDYGGVKKKVSDVRITEKMIIVELEPVENSTRY